MGDPARFRLFADLIRNRFSDGLTVCDVAGGNGMLRSQLFSRGFSDVTTVDKRQRLAKGRPARSMASSTTGPQPNMAW